MKSNFVSVSVFRFFLVLCPILFLLISCQKAEDEEKVQVLPLPPSPTNNFGVLQIQYTYTHPQHIIVVTTSSDTIVKISSSFQTYDTLQLAPGLYDVYIGQTFQEQTDIHSLKSLDTTCAITPNTITTISVPF